jgi:hypothetical protein
VRGVILSDAGDRDFIADFGLCTRRKTGAKALPPFSQSVLPNSKEGNHER